MISVHPSHASVPHKSNLLMRARKSLLKVQVSGLCTGKQASRGAQVPQKKAAHALLMSSRLDARWLPHRRQVNTLPCTQMLLQAYPVRICGAKFSGMHAWHLLLSCVREARAVLLVSAGYIGMS